MPAPEPPATLRRAAKDPAALERLYGRHGEDILLFFARRTLDPQLALELTAVTFATALGWPRRAARRSGEDATAAALLRHAERQHERVTRRGRVGRTRRHGRCVAALARRRGDVGRVTEAAELERLRAGVAAGVAELPRIHREAVRLRILEGHSYEAIAARLGVSVPTARGRVCRGLRLLQQQA